ncbi:MAG: 4a-hydroxytetrahydrobiopterin dehydratase [Fimbriimonadaceae bacterium]|nr:4a-hydroxytetrahydrobiopterin dehydratase [Fimbriimonadaceae bacterium]
MSRDRLSDEALNQGLESLTGWDLQDGMLRREFTFAAYASGVVFAAAVGHVADGMDHHPDILIGYRKVVVSTVTHDAGGLTELDLRLARRISELV